MQARVKPGTSSWPARISAAAVSGTRPGYQGCGSFLRHCRHLRQNFYRNAFNIGLPIFGIPGAAAEINEGDEVEVDAATGLITNHTTGKTYRAAPVPPFMQQIIAAGGLIPYVAEKVKKNV